MKLLSSLFLSIGLTLLPTLPISAAEDKGAEQVKQQKVNINKASVEQLTLLPGVYMDSLAIVLTVLFL